MAATTSAPPGKIGLTPAEAYANAHYPMRRDKEKQTGHVPGGSTGSGGGGGGGVGGKPIFEWITRKLGARRASIGSGSPSSSATPSRLSSMAHRKPYAHAHTKPTAHGTGASVSPGPGAGAVGGNAAPATPTVAGPTILGPRPTRQLSPAQIFTSAAPAPRRDSASRSESHSLRSYSQSYKGYTESARRAANNPYPSIPVPLRRDSTIESSGPSISFITRSRTPSIRSNRSMSSSLRPRISYADDGSGSGSLRLAGQMADEDASVRPIPPSHPASPTPSTSFLSRSASASLLAPQIAHRSPSPTHPIRPRPETHHSASSAGAEFSFTSSEPDEGPGRQSRQNSTSTKQTTIVSFDSGPHIAHIAQSPIAGPAGPASSSNHAGPSTLPPSPLRGSIARDMISMTPREGGSPGSSSPSGGSQGVTPISSPMTTSPVASPTLMQAATISLVQAPKRSAPHPRDNPHPASPPEPNASTLTLASSTFAAPPPGTSWTPSITPSGMYSPISSIPSPHTPQSGLGPVPGQLPNHRAPSIHMLRENPNPPTNHNHSVGRPPSLATSPSVTWAPGPGSERPGSVYEYPPSLHPTLGTSMRTGGGWGRGPVADRDASVRAVRRKGSWESYESGWSWRGGSGVGAGGAVGVNGVAGSVSGYGLGQSVGPGVGSGSASASASASAAASLNHGPGALASPIEVEGSSLDQPGQEAAAPDFSSTRNGAGARPEQGPGTEQAENGPSRDLTHDTPMLGQGSSGMTGVVGATDTPDVAFSEPAHLVPPTDVTPGGSTILNGAGMVQDRETERESLYTRESLCTRESLYTRESFVTARSTGSVDG